MAGAAGRWRNQCVVLGLWLPACLFLSVRRGMKTHCARRTVLGIVAHDGAFAEYLALPLENLHIVPDSVSDEQAVFAEPLAAACEILEQVDTGQFREAAVLGDGKLAQLIALVLRTAVGRVVMYGKHKKKLALARGAGIETKKVSGGDADLKRVKRKLWAFSSKRRARRADSRLLNT